MRIPKKDLFGTVKKAKKKNKDSMIKRYSESLIDCAHYLEGFLAEKILWRQ